MDLAVDKDALILIECKQDIFGMNHIGVDIIEIARIREAISRWKERFLHRVFTDAELGLYREEPSSLAARFAAKEAVWKAIGNSNRGIGWKDIEILSEPDGKPSVRLYGKARNQADSLSLNNLAISLSHSREYAIAFIIGETK